MTEQQFTKEFIAKLGSITNKRPKTVIDHILKHGYITTEELKNLYGYNHAPRAARDVREEGIPLETFRVKNSDGRSIGAYRFADPKNARFDTLDGRKIFSKAFKDEIINTLGCKCTICLESYEDRYLQVDHRAPYEVSGDSDAENRVISDYMVLCGSCNRAKSWSCEHCINFKESKNIEVCRTCYWASPNSYVHIALQEIRRIDVVWRGDEIPIYNALKQNAEKLKVNIPEYVKSALKKHIQNKNKA